MLQFLLKGCTFAWLVDHASGVRTSDGQLDFIARGNFHRCLFSGPEGGPRFLYGRTLPNLRSDQDCQFTCDAVKREFDSKTMPDAITSSFANMKCSCSAGARNLVTVGLHSSGWCTPKYCWEKYKQYANLPFGDESKHLAPNNWKAECEPCEDQASCETFFEYAEIDDMLSAATQAAPEVMQKVQDAIAEVGVSGRNDTARGLAVAALTNAVQLGEFSGEAVTAATFVQTLLREKVVARGLLGAETRDLESMRYAAQDSGGSTSTNPAEGTSTSSPGDTTPASSTEDPDAAGQVQPCNPVVGPFPNQCIVTLDASAGTYLESRVPMCTGNQLLVQVDDSKVVALTIFNLDGNVFGGSVPASSPLPGVDDFDGMTFSFHFHVRSQGGGVEIKFVDEDGWGTMPLDYGLSDGDSILELKYTQSLFLKPHGAKVSYEQRKPDDRQTGGSLWIFGMASMGSRTTPKPSQQGLVDPLDPAKYSGNCLPVRLEYGNTMKVEVSYEPPRRLQLQ